MALPATGVLECRSAGNDLNSSGFVPGGSGTDRSQSDTPFVTFDGKKHDWPVELGNQLLRTVRESKMWMNENAGWYEGDPVLVTSYVLNICDILFKHVK